MESEFPPLGEGKLGLPEPYLFPLVTHPALEAASLGLLMIECLGGFGNWPAVLPSASLRFSHGETPVRTSLSFQTHKVAL